MGNRQAANLGQTSMNNITQNATASGFGGGIQSPFQQEMMQNQQRANTGLSANLGFINPTQMANQRQQQAIGQLANWQPLQTGQNQTQKTGGLGTWLPQVAGMALGGLTGGLASGGLMGGLSSLFGGPMGVAGVGSQFGPTGMSGAMNSLLNQNALSGLGNPVGSPWFSMGPSGGYGMSGGGGGPWSYG